jgi:hypothetical protein
LIPLYFDYAHIDLHLNNNNNNGRKKQPIKTNVYEVIIVISTLAMISATDEGAAGVMIINHCHTHARIERKKLQASKNTHIHS